MRRLSGFSLLVALAFLAAPDARAESVTPKAAAIVTGDTVMLSDMFSGITPAQDKPVFKAPALGQTVTLNATQLAFVAHTQGLAWQPAHPLLRLPITRSAQRIGADAMQSAITPIAQKALGVEAVAVALDNRNLHFFLPSAAPAELNVADFTAQEDGRFRAVIRAAVNTEHEQNHIVTGRLERLRAVPVLKARTEAGATLRGSDLVTALRPENQLPPDVITAPADLHGVELRRGVPAGAFVRPADLRPRRLVAKNDRIAILYQTPGMELRAQGRALMDGAAGDTVSVLNTQSKQTLEAVVVAPGVVSVSPQAAPSRTRVLARSEVSAAGQASSEGAVQ